MRVIKNPNPPAQGERSKPSPYCGRIDEHPSHIHHTHGPEGRKPIRCPGTPVTEGGQRT